MPSTVEVNVDSEEKQGTLPPTTEKGSKESTPMDLAPAEVKHGNKRESSSSKNTVRGTAAKKTSNRRNDGPDSNFTPTSPKKNAGVQMAPSDRKQKEASSRRDDVHRNDTRHVEKRRDDRSRHRYRRDNKQGHSNNQGHS